MIFDVFLAIMPFNIKNSTSNIQYALLYNSVQYMQNQYIIMIAKINKKSKFPKQSEQNF